ncbi:MAG: hypothetical protein AAF236_11030, partial [Verrucomicrobiota bacterium]
MAGEIASDLKTTIGPKVSTTRPIQTLAQVRALKPEETLKPLSGLFAQASDETQFVRFYAQYVQSLIGASAVWVHELGEESGQSVAKPVAMALVDGDSLQGRKTWAVAPEQVVKTISGKTSQQVDLVVMGRQHVRLMVPFFLKNASPICVTAFLPPERIAFREPCFTLLHLSTQFLVQRELLSDAQENAHAFGQATLLVDMFSRTGEADTFNRAVFTLVTELEKFFGCQRVALGTGSSRSCKVHAVSGMSSEEKRSLGLSQLSTAMRESIALGEIMVWPGQTNVASEAVVSANHDDLLHSFKSSRVVIAPLYHEPSNTRGALALLWPPGLPEVTPQLFRLLGASQPHVGALVSFLKKSKPGALGGGIQRFWKSSVLKRSAAMVGVIALVILLFFPVTYRLPADGEIQPVVRRTVAAPFQNRLYRTYVKPGDEVAAGEPLAE